MSAAEPVFALQLTLGSVLTLIGTVFTVGFVYWRIAKHFAKDDATITIILKSIKTQGEALEKNQEIIQQHIDECNERREDQAALKEKVESHEKRLDVISTRQYDFGRE